MNRLQENLVILEVIRALLHRNKLKGGHKKPALQKNRKSLELKKLATLGPLRENTSKGLLQGISNNLRTGRTKRSRSKRILLPSQSLSFQNRYM